MKNLFRSTFGRYIVGTIMGIVIVLTMSAFAPTQEKVPVVNINLSSLPIILAGALALVADYFPGAATWYDTLTPASKRIVMLAAVILIVGAVLGGQCAGWLATNLVCSTNGAVDALVNIVFAFAIGQGVHGLFKPSSEFKAEQLGIDPRKSNKVGI